MPEGERVARCAHVVVDGLHQPRPGLRQRLGQESHETGRLRVGPERMNCSEVVLGEVADQQAWDDDAQCRRAAQRVLIQAVHPRPVRGHRHQTGRRQVPGKPAIGIELNQGRSDMEIYHALARAW